MPTVPFRERYYVFTCLKACTSLHTDFRFMYKRVTTFRFLETEHFPPVSYCHALDSLRNPLRPIVRHKTRVYGGHGRESIEDHRKRSTSARLINRPIISTGDSDGESVNPNRSVGPIGRSAVHRLYGLKVCVFSKYGFV